jgi:type IV pilus assembly protein PilN
VNKETTRIAQQLVAFPGGSPLLEQLRRVTPVGVQLQELSVGEAQIQLSGKAQIGASPGPLERINAFALSLSQLPITLEKGVKVMKITREDGDDSAVTFSVNWALNPTARLSLIQLQELGAIGLAERYRLIEQRGVPL